MDHFSPIHPILQSWLYGLPPVSFSLQSLMREKFDDKNDLETVRLNFFYEKPQDFYERRMLSLAERWRRVIDSNGAYVVER